MFKFPLFQNIDSLPQLVLWLLNIYSRLSGGNLVKFIVVDIGDWDMDATASVTVDYKQAVGDTDFKRVLGVSVQIFNDAMTDSYFTSDVDDGMTSVKVDSTTTKVTLTRKGSGFFDGTDYDSTSIDTRGKITLCLST